MRRAGIFLTILGVLALLAWLPSCRSPESPAGGVDEELYTRDEVPNLDDPYGGFNLNDEAPAFGDQDLQEQFSPSSEVAYADRMEQDPRIDVINRRPIPKLYLRITWGNLRRDSTVNFATDWSGSLTVDNGVVVLKRLIRFEPGDRILLRTARDKIEWISHTGLGFDGILVKVLPVPELQPMATVIDSATVITFATEPLTVSFTFAELINIHRVIPVDSMGNAVAFDAVHLPPFPCPQGFLAGIWRDNPDTVGGIFFGKWVSADGELRGHLRGFYGVNSNGEHVFFGKYVDMSGRFRGILRGTYERFGGSNMGYFQGVWINRNLRIVGDLRGIWLTDPRRQHGGFFAGHWRVRCR